MNKLLTIIVFSISLFTIACQNTAEKVDQPVAKMASAEDSLYKQTMDIHNEVMAKMGKLMGYEKQAQQKSDSIKAILASTSFTKEISQKMAADVNKTDTLHAKLEAADKAMNDWMEKFDADPKMPTTEERAAYFADQKAKATTMRNQFFDALKEAEAYFAGNK